MQVWKYQIEPNDIVVFEMPKGARPLSVAYQPGVGACLWALVDPDAEMVLHKFRMVGTGHEIPELYTKDFIGTFQMEDGRLVFHLFDLGE